MKRLFLTFSFLAMCLVALSQEKFSSYENSYDGQTYSVQVSSKDTSSFDLYIDAESLDALHKFGGIKISSKKFNDFVSSLKEAKEKYIEWDSTARINNVKDLSKPMDISCKVEGYFLYGKEWKFQFSVPLKFKFKIIDGTSTGGTIQYLLIVSTGELTASSNQFMKVDGFVFVFSTPSEIDEFLNIIAYQKIIDFIKKPKQEDLFK